MATAGRRGRTARTAGKGVTPHRDNRGNRCTALGGVSTVSDPPSTFDTPAYIREMIAAIDELGLDEPTQRLVYEGNIRHLITPGPKPAARHPR